MVASQFHNLDIKLGQIFYVLGEIEGLLDSYIVILFVSVLEVNVILDGKELFCFILKVVIGCLLYTSPSPRD